ncbi:hypothetical protein K7432_005694 [Basidiobolus ranarum]|uniref:Uncharacterized protein n=1 Tax=Basidiobolus ranarum TaxID=34480 RepID=A0ABR2W2R8_9FUNG
MRQPTAYLLLVSLLSLVKAHSTVDPDARLSNYDFVSNPQIDIYRHSYDDTHPKVTKRSLKNIPQLLHDDSFRVQFQAFNRTFHLHMEPNTDLIHPQAEIVTYDSTGNPKSERLFSQKYLVYKGLVVEPEYSESMLNQEIIGLHSPYRIDPNAASKGWARLLVHQDHKKTLLDEQYIYEGVFSLGPETYHVQPITSYKLSKRFQDPEVVNPSARPPYQRRSSSIIYRLSDQKASQNHIKRGFNHAHGSDKASACGSEGLKFNQNITKITPHYDWTLGGIHNRLEKRAPVANSGCPTSKKVMYMGVAADCTYVKNYKGVEAATKSILSNWNIASGVYEKTFNIALGVAKLEMRSEICPTTLDNSVAWNRECSDSYDINARLNDFTRWRGTLGDDNNGLWHLVTRCSTGSKVGVAWLSQTCVTSATQQDSDYVSGTGVSSITSTEWKVIAHEIGHNFGAKHDCVSSQCPCQSCECCPCDGTCDCNGKYLMNPTSETGSNDFSPCSIRDICGSVPNIGSCLEVPGSKNIIRQAMCGNGIKEEGEECDCGSAEDCQKSACCTSTCKLKAGAVCSDDGDDCCKDCQLKAANTTCRAAQSECDIVETCDGVSPSCPKDNFIEDGKDCGSSGAGLKCASGLCTSRDAQCAARGQRQNIVKACSNSFTSNPCQFVCASPNQPNACVIMQGAFIDGTTCGAGGKCLKGSCQSGNIGK